MKKFVFFVLSALLFSAACSISPTANKVLVPISPVTLQSVTAKFRTTSNDKDDDTKLDVLLKKKDDTVIADAKGAFGKYENNSDHSVPLEKHGDFSQADLDQSKLNIHIAPNGEDQWDFNLILEFKFSDTTTVSKFFNGNVLTEKNPDLNVVVNLAEK